MLKDRLLAYSTLLSLIDHIEGTNLNLILVQDQTDFPAGQTRPLLCREEENVQSSTSCHDFSGREKNEFVRCLAHPLLQL